MCSLSPIAGQEKLAIAMNSLSFQTGTSLVAAPGAVAKLSAEDERRRRELEEARIRADADFRAAEEKRRVRFILAILADLIPIHRRSRLRSAPRTSGGVRRRKTLRVRSASRRRARGPRRSSAPERSSGGSRPRSSVERTR